MKITKTSILSGKERTVEMPAVTEERLEDWRPKNGNPGKRIQEVFPDLSADEREFLLTGITVEEWDEKFGGGVKKPNPPSNYHQNLRKERQKR